MLLSIITVNLNNASGLDKTIMSVLSQSHKEIEYIVIDGASSDGSLEIISKYSKEFGERLKWTSEPDSGIYNAMNKGIRMANGEYVQFLNSGDCLADKDVIERMIAELEKKYHPYILYGNMLKVFSDGNILKDKCFAENDISFLGFYTGTLNHSPAFIKRSLFEEYGMYDDTLKIVSDWKWYLQSIILGNVEPVYCDIDVTLFDMYGISETNKALDKAERRQVLEQLIPAKILKDYDDFAFPIDQIKRLKRHPWAYKIVWFIERCLFKLEKAQRKHNSISQNR